MFQRKLFSPMKKFFLLILISALSNSGVATAAQQPTDSDLLEADGLFQDLAGSSRRVGMAEIIDG
jgi:hypothetical protein